MRKKIIFIYAIVKHLRRFYEKEIELFCVFIKDQMTGNKINVVNILIGNNNKKSQWMNSKEELHHVWPLEVYEGRELWVL